MTAEDAMAKVDKVIDAFVMGEITHSQALTRITRISGLYGLSNLDRAGA